MSGWGGQGLQLLVVISERGSHAKEEAAEGEAPPDSAPGVLTMKTNKFAGGKNSGKRQASTANPHAKGPGSARKPANIAKAVKDTKHRSC